jgi:hypothetical protein
MFSSEYRENFCLHDVVDFSIEGSGPLYDYLSYQYQYFRNEEIVVKDPVILKFNSSNDVVPGIILKNGKERFAIDKSKRRFLWMVGDSKLTLDGTLPLSAQTEIIFDKNFNKMSANQVIELLWRLKFSSREIALVHAACIARAGQAILLSAWKGMRKTAACLKMVKEGYDFLADDRVWISAAGEVLAYPRYVVLKDSNAPFFPEFIPSSAKIKLWLMKKFNNLQAINRSGIFFRCISRFLKVPAKYYYIAELYPDAKTIQHDTLGKVVFLSQQNDLTRICIDSVHEEAVASKTYDIGNVEWNYSLLTLASAHDVLFEKGPKWVDEILELMKKDKWIISQAFTGKKCFIATLPADDRLIDWPHLAASIPLL